MIINKYIFQIILNTFDTTQFLIYVKNYKNIDSCLYKTIKIKIAQAIIYTNLTFRNRTIK